MMKNALHSHNTDLPSLILGFGFSASQKRNESLLQISRHSVELTAFHHLTSLFVATL
jgi:hypothetical protein